MTYAVFKKKTTPHDIQNQTIGFSRNLTGIRDVIAKYFFWTSKYVSKIGISPEFEEILECRNLGGIDFYSYHDFVSERNLAGLWAEFKLEFPPESWNYL